MHQNHYLLLFIVMVIKCHHSSKLFLNENSFSLFFFELKLMELGAHGKYKASVQLHVVQLDPKHSPEHVSVHFLVVNSVLVLLQRVEHVTEWLVQVNKFSSVAIAIHNLFYTKCAYYYHVPMKKFMVVHDNILRLYDDLIIYFHNDILWNRPKY